MMHIPYYGETVEVPPALVVAAAEQIEETQQESEDKPISVSEEILYAV